jgi:outer membrane protein assembly factor BamB
VNAAQGVRARVVPIVALSALVAVLVAMRVARRRTAARAPVTSTAAVTASSVVSDLRGTRPSEPARVIDHAPRMIHGDPRHTHRARGRGPRSARVAWTATLGGPIEAQVVASPDEKALYVASLDGTLTALGRDGASLWHVALGDRVYSTPCVADDGTIYVGSDARRFAAIAPDGHIKWRLETEGDADTGAAIAPNGTIVFAAGKTVYAARPGGDVAWRFQAKAKVFTAPAIADDGTIVFGSQDHRVYALTPSGALAWATDLGADVDAAPAIGDDGAIFVGADSDEIFRLGAKGEIAWRTKVGGFVRGVLSVTRGGDVMAGVFGPTPRQIRVAGADGAIRGALAVQGTGAREFGVVGGALEDDAGTLYFGAQDDFVYAVAEDGSILWKLATGGDVDAPLTLLTSGELIAPSDDGKVYLLAP